MLHNSSIRFFIFVVALYIILFQIIILIIPKGCETIYFFENRTSFWTTFFRYCTRFGEWIPLTILAVYLLATNRMKFFSALMGFVPLDLFMIGMKKIINAPRPLSYFPHGDILAIENYYKLYHESMPSGHTFTIFFVMTIVCLFLNLNKKWISILFFIAALVGISRMYLVCHFKEDVFVGSVLGISAGIISLFIYNKWLKKYEV